MTYKSHIPNGITIIRLLAAPVFIYAFLNDYSIIPILILILAGITDVLDGYIARKMNLTSDLGAYLDVSSDFIFILSCFLAFMIKGWYDPLTLLLIISMFLLFIATSGLKKPVYDPVGKYLGVYLLLMILLSILFPEESIRKILILILAFISLVSVLSRSLIFLR